MSRESCVSGILYEFYTQNTRWKVDGKFVEPTEDDIGKVLDRLAEAVYDGEENTQAQTGGILVKKQDGHVDVYLHLGEL